MENINTNSIKYYDDYTLSYFNDTVDIDLTKLYKPFLELLPEGGKILDVGCGSGRDKNQFLDCVAKTITKHQLNSYFRPKGGTEWLKDLQL